VTVRFPQGAVPDGTKVTITKGGAPNDKLAGGQSLGPAFNIDLGGQKLAKPVTLEIAFDPKKLPKDSSAQQAFLAFYDEAKKSWIPVTGQVDTQRTVIVSQTDHLSWWNPFSWNWGAWVAVLDNALTGNVTDFLHAVALLTTDCPQSGTTVSVDASKANNVIQGCVQHDDPSSPQLRVVNPKSFFFEVKPISGGNGYPPDTMLGPGDGLKFQAAISDPAPLIVQAEITQKAGLYLVVHLIIQMLPGLNELGIQGPQIACITEKLSDVSYFVSAAEALLVSHDGPAAAEQLVHFLNDGGAVQRFITAASDCNYGAAPTWSVEGLKQIGGATATIISATDFVANYLLNSKSQVAFSWKQQIPPTPTPRSWPPCVGEEYKGTTAGLGEIEFFLYAQDSGGYATSCEAGVTALTVNIVSNTQSQCFPAGYGTGAANTGNYAPAGNFVVGASSFTLERSTILWKDSDALEGRIELRADFGLNDSASGTLRWTETKKDGRSCDSGVLNWSAEKTRNLN
jgi:hypothetical protein